MNSANNSSTLLADFFELLSLPASGEAANLVGEEQRQAGEARGQEGAQCTEHALGALAVGEEREARAVLRRVPLGAPHVHVDAGLPKSGAHS